MPDDTVKLEVRDRVARRDTDPGRDDANMAIFEREGAGPGVSGVQPQDGAVQVLRVAAGETSSLLRRPGTS